jgi:membrane dipeptidase
MWRLGLRSLGLAYTAGNLFADGCGETRNGGLTFLGKDLISAVNELPMLLDLSHCSHRTRAEAVELSRAPVCTHSNAYGENPNDRNTKDETVREIVKKGGAIGICALPKSVRPENPTLEDMLDHCDYFVSLVGKRHVGIGLDFTEGYQESRVTLPESARWRTWRPDMLGTVDDFQTQSYPRGLQSIRLLPNLTQGLFDRGYTEKEAAAILGGNWLRVFRKFVG